MCSSAKIVGAEHLRITERYILSVTATFSLTTFAISFYAASGLDLYVSLYIVEFFILTLLHSPFNTKTQRIINFTSYGLFGLFVIIVALKVLQILAGSLI
jgi:hypothetical protein